MNDGGRVFPGIEKFFVDHVQQGVQGLEKIPIEKSRQHSGLTMRQWYKGMAMTTLLELFRVSDREEQVFKNIAYHSGKIADVMIKEDEEYEQRTKGE